MAVKYTRRLVEHGGNIPGVALLIALMAAFGSAANCAEAAVAGAHAVVDALGGFAPPAGFFRDGVIRGVAQHPRADSQFVPPSGSRDGADLEAEQPSPHGQPTGPLSIAEASRLSLANLLAANVRIPTADVRVTHALSAGCDGGGFGGGKDKGHSAAGACGGAAMGFPGGCKGDGLSRRSARSCGGRKFNVNPDGVVTGHQMFEPKASEVEQWLCPKCRQEFRLDRRRPRYPGLAWRQEFME